MKHIAVFDKETIQKIFTGRKTLEIRLSQKKVVPFEKVSAGDDVFIKESGGPVRGKFRAGKVEFFRNFDKKGLLRLKSTFGDKLAVDSGFWQKRMKSRFATLISIKSTEKFPRGLKMSKSDRRPWVILGKKSDPETQMQLKLDFNDSLVTLQREITKRRGSLALKDVVSLVQFYASKISKTVSKKKSRNFTKILSAEDKKQLVDDLVFIIINTLDLSGRLRVDLARELKKKLTEGTDRFLYR